MLSPLLWIVLLTTITTLITTIGVPALNALLWNLYTGLSPASPKLQKHNKLRTEVLVLKKELLQTSSQDEFAKWAKIRRILDKKTAEYTKYQEELKGTKAAFESRTTWVRWILTTGLRLGLQVWYAKTAMFWVPAGWLPGYVEWVLAFPKAPRGSVSIQVWVFAVGQVVSVLVEVVQGLLKYRAQEALAAKAKTAEVKTAEVPMEGRKAEL